jgi:transcriptional regulator GlxA family with amidase domain
MASIQFGVLMIDYQALDAVGPIDILSNVSKKFLVEYEKAGFPGCEGLGEKAIDITFHHIGLTLNPVELTAGIRMLPTTTYDTCPPLDILLVGGPDPYTFKLNEQFAEFVKAHVGAGRTLFTTCTGAWAIASTGVLDGKNATTNHAMIDFAIQQYPKVNWTKEKQWVVDGNLWTAGGALAGMDMVAHWVLQNYSEVARFGFTSLDFEPRDVNGKANQVIPPQHGVANV